LTLAKTTLAKAASHHEKPVKKKILLLAVGYSLLICAWLIAAVD
jgi:hypothetical protein